MTSPLVSVIVPVYNRSHSILPTLSSILNQTYKNYEIIVVNDGSTDNTFEVLQTLKNSIILINQSNQGQASAKNAALIQAKGDIIAPLDSDDLWNSDYLERGIEGLLKAESDLYISNWIQAIYRFSDVKYKKSHLPDNSTCFMDYNVFKDFIFEENLGANSGMIFRKDILKNGWNENIYIGDDWYLLIELVLSKSNLKIGYSASPRWVKGRFHDNICDGKKGKEFREKHLSDIDRIFYDFKDKMSESQRDKLYAKKLQNIILLSIYNPLYLRYLKGGAASRIVHQVIYKGSLRFIRNYF